MDRNNVIEDPQKLAFRTTRQGLLARYAGLIPLVWLLTGFPVPAGRTAILLAAIATLVVNAACHLHLTITRRHVLTAYLSPAMDFLLVIGVVANTGMLASPFIMILPLFPIAIFHAEFSRKRTLWFMAALLALFGLTLGAWSLGGGRSPAWNPAEYPAFTGFVCFHQLLALLSLAAISLELSPLADVVAQGQARLEASMHRAELGASLGSVKAGLAPHLDAMNAALTRLDAITARVPGDRGKTVSGKLADCRREVATMRRLLEGLGAPGGGAVKGEKRAVVAADLLGRAADFMRRKHSRLGRTVLYEQVPAGKVTVTCDADEMHRVLVGLMENALSRRVEGRPMRIRLAAEARGTDTVLTVSDNGDPLPQGATDAVLAAAPPQDPGDPAAWLFLARRIAGEHGGTMTASSAAGGVTAFAVSLPGPGAP